MDIYRVKHMSSNDTFRGTSTVIAKDAWDAVEVYLQHSPLAFEMGDKYKVTLPKGLTRTAGWKVSPTYVDEYGDEDDFLEMWFSIGVCYTENGGDLVLLFSPGITWVRLNESTPEPIDLIVKWLK